MPFFMVAIFFLGACSAEQPPGKVEPTASKQATPEQLTLAAGQKIYESNCAGCHDSGVGGAPKLGDKKAWNGLLSRGKDFLLQHAIQGFEGKKGAMPPKGGNESLSDEEVKNATTYMISKLGVRPSDDNREPMEKYQ